MRYQLRLGKHKFVQTHLRRVQQLSSWQIRRDLCSVALVDAGASRLVEAILALRALSTISQATSLHLRKYRSNPWTTRGHFRGEATLIWRITSSGEEQATHATHFLFGYPSKPSKEVSWWQCFSRLKIIHAFMRSFDYLRKWATDWCAEWITEINAQGFWVWRTEERGKGHLFVGECIPETLMGQVMIWKKSQLEALRGRGKTWEVVYYAFVIEVKINTLLSQSHPGYSRFGQQLH